MLIDRTHRRWFYFSLVTLVVSTLAYAWYVASRPQGPSGGSIPGLLFGILAAGAMIFCGLLSVRKLLPRMPLGKAQTWLRAHIWFGLLTLPWVLFHAGFGFGGRLEQVLMAVFFAVYGSGILGLIFEQFLPRSVTLGVPNETIYSQIPHACQLLRDAGDALVAEVCGPWQQRPDQNSSPATPEASAADKIVAMKSVKKTAPKPKADGEQGMTAAEKIAAMRAAKKPSQPEPEASATGDDKPLSTADKIAAMRAAKQPAEQKVLKKDEPPAANTGKSLSTADKIAAMRAAKAKPQNAEDAEDATADKKTSTAAEKIALMRAAKAKDAPTANKPASEQSPVSAAEKIAAMRAGKASPAKAKAKATPPARKKETGPVPGSEPLRRFYLDEVRPFLATPSRSESRLADPTKATAAFAQLETMMPPSRRVERAAERLANLCAQRRQLMVQARLFELLQGWLLIHVPLSLALLVLGVAHAAMSLYY